MESKVDLKEVIKAAFKYLGKKELHVNDLADYIKGFVSEYQSEDIEVLRKKISSKLSSDVKLRTKQPTFTKVSNGKRGFKKGVYALRVIKEKPNPIKPDQNIKIETSLFDSEENKNAENFSNIFDGLSTIQIGKGGEFAVVSEMLFRGFNATSMTVDDGVDIVAAKEKEGRFFFVQVKTTTCLDNTFSVNIDKNSYSKYNVSNMFYVIVIRFLKNNLPQNQYLIFNSYDIEKMVSRDLVGVSHKYLSMRFKMWNGGIHVVRQGKNDDVSFHLNNWGWIK